MSLYTPASARKSLIHTASFRSVSQVASMAAYVVLVRGLGKEDFGVFNLLYAFIPVVSTVASFGLEQTLRRYQPEYLQANKKSAAHWLVKCIAVARVLSNLAVLGVILLAWNYFAPLFGLADYRMQFIVFGAVVLLFFQTRLLQLSLAAHMLHRYSVGSMAVLSISKLIAYGGLYFFGSFTLVHAIVADASAYFVCYVFLSIAYRRACLTGWTAERYWPDRSERKRLFKYGLYNNFNDAGTFVLGVQSDNFFIAAFLSPVAVAVYSFYNRLSIMTAQLMPTSIFQNVIQPMFFAVPPAEADRQLPRYYTLLMNTSLVVRWPVLAYSLVYHAEIVQVVFGGKYVEYSWLLPLVVAFSVLNVVATPATLVAQYEEKPLILLVSKVFLIYNVLAMLALLPIAGLYGAAFATGSANVFKNLLIWWQVRGRARWTNGWAAVLNGVAIWAAAIATCYGLKVALGGPMIGQLALGGVVCTLAVLVFIRSGAIAPSDRAILASLSRGRERQWLSRVGLLKQAA